MIRFLFFSFLVISGVGCKEKNLSLDLPLKITKSDTVFLDVENLIVQNVKTHLDRESNRLVLHHDRKMWWIDLLSKKLNKSIDFDTTNIILPESTIQQTRYLNQDGSILLFFPGRSSIVHLNSELNIVKEIRLDRISDLGYTFLFKGENFYFDYSTKEYFIGMMSDKFQDPETYLKETKFIGVFNESGDLIQSFGGFGEKRKELKSNIMTEGIFHFDVLDDKIYLREVAADPSIMVYDLKGKEIRKFEIGTNEISYQIHPMASDGDFFSTSSSDQFYSMKVVSNDLVVSNTFSRKYLNEKFTFESFLVVEDLKNSKSYSSEIPAFQKVVSATESQIYLLSNHPTKEDLILVTLEYSLGDD